MPKPVNPSIGSCPCSFRDCTHRAAVKKEKGPRARLYLVCPTHGVINLGASMQEYILEHASLNGPGGASTEPATVPEHAPDVPRGSSAPAGTNIERGPAPEPYPDGVQLERASPAPARAPAQPRPVPPEKAKEKTTTSQRPGVPGLRWLTDGLNDL